MKNYHEKRRDMCRSILPSTAPKSARESKQNANRRLRRNTANIIASYDWNGDPDEYDTFYNDLAALEFSVSEEIKEMVSERRGHDKVAPIMKWAEKITDHLDDPEDRRAHMWQIVPDNLIGRHAMSHIEYQDKFYVADEYNNGYVPGEYARRQAEARRNRREQNFLAYLKIHEVLVEVCKDRKMLMRFNTIMAAEYSVLVGRKRNFNVKKNEMRGLYGYTYYNHYKVEDTFEDRPGIVLTGGVYGINKFLRKISKINALRERLALFLDYYEGQDFAAIKRMAA